MVIKISKRKRKGMFLKMEKDIAGSFKRIGYQEGKLLVIYIPAGFGNFFKNISSMDIEAKAIARNN